MKHQRITSLPWNYDDEPERKEPIMTAENTIHDIPLKNIHPPAWDSRVADPRQDKDWPEFVESMKKGQLQPIIVEGPYDSTNFGLPDGAEHYVRIFGGRREAAAVDLGWETIKAIVRPTTDAATRIVDNARENLERKNLTSYETARAFAALREAGLTGDEIGKRFSLSKQRVTNLVTPLAKLPAPILEDWKNNVPAVDTELLRQIAVEKVDDDEKVRRWEAHKKEVASRTDPNTGKVKKKTPRKPAREPAVSMVQANYNVLCRFVHSKKAPAKLGKDKVPKLWLSALLAYLVGDADMPPDGIKNDPAFHDALMKGGES